MRSYFAPAIAIAMIMTAILSARSDDIPTLDVRPANGGGCFNGVLWLAVMAIVEDGV